MVGRVVIQVIYLTLSNRDQRSLNAALRCVEGNTLLVAQNSLCDPILHLLYLPFQVEGIRGWGLQVDYPLNILLRLLDLLCSEEQLGSLLQHSRPLVFIDVEQGGENANSLLLEP